MKSYRKDFPIFRKNPKLVYLDSAATSQKPKVVLDAMQEYYINYNSNVRRGLYPIAEKATGRVEEVRKQVAKFINAKFSEEIIFTRNATEGINLVAYSSSHNISSRDTILTTIMEHHSNFVPWQQLAYSKKAKFEVLDFNVNYELTINNEQFKKAKILAITHVSNVLGIINPIKEIIKKVRKVNPQMLILVDAAQSISHMKVDVQDLDCDFLVFSGHKMFASTGIGVLYGKKEKLKKLSPFLFGGEMIEEVNVGKTTFADLPYRFEAGTPDIAGIISLGAAIEYINSLDINSIQKHSARLMAYSLLQMEKIDGIEIYGSRNLQKRSSVISFNLSGIHSHDVAQVLGDKNICIRSGHHCAQPLHRRLGVSASARISFSVYNDERDIDVFFKSLQNVQKLFSVQ